MKIGLLGHGVVGKGVSRICDVSKTLQVKRILVKDDWELTDPRCTQNVQDILGDPEIDVVVECMGGIEPARTFLMKAIQNHKHVVTSNKKMLANCCEDLFAEAEKNNVSIHYEATCGGGIPWMASLERILRIDPVDSFRGIFNGTTNYILSRMDLESLEFEPLLKEAQQLGYAEQNPSDDIDGMDVKYKVALSCMKAFGVIPVLDEIPTYGIRYIQKKDLDYAKSKGMTCKLIGTGIKKEGSIEASVLPVFLKKEDVLANTSMNFNAIESDSATLGKAVFTGQGAGSLPTAHAVVQDIYDIENKEAMEYPSLQEVTVINSAEKIFYLRSKQITDYADILDQQIDAETYLTKKISLDDLQKKIQEDKEIFIAEVQE
ncbi:MAG: homoserine dehydrogenase [Solobacterium sp.]|nr:homoserine dehydrogenase [Solobacterium sp.]